MKKGAKRILAALLSLSMLISTWTPAITAEAATKLVNVALDGTASTESGENGDYVIGHVNDGDDSTSWQTPGTWPATAEIKLPGGRKISKVVVKLGEKGNNSTGNTVLVDVRYAMNNVVDTEYQYPIGKATRATVDSDITFNLNEPSSATHVYVTLSSPQQKDGSVAGFCPSIEEIEIYEEQEIEAISSYPNIASQAEITATGGNEKPDEGSGNLVDGDPATLYKFYNAAMTSEQSIILTYKEARSMDAFAIAFENAGASDDITLAFNYSILARNGNGEYDTIADRVTANRTNKSSQQYSFQEKTYSEVKIVMHSCTTSSGAGWPAVAEFEVYGNEIIEEDTANIALKKSVHASSGRNLAKNLTDGSKNTAWKGTYYPAYVDIDLKKNYYLDTVEIFTPEKGYSQYTIYTSMDGRNFDKLAEKLSTERASLETGEVYAANGKEARIVRVYLEYSTAENAAAIINEVRVTGRESETPIKNRPAIAVKDYMDSQYANKVFTVEDTYNEVYGIIERRLGEDYKDWFDLKIESNPDGTGYDYFELSNVEGKVQVKGNNGVSLATGINHFLKYYCNVNISQVGDQVKMPAAIPVIDTTVHKETKAKVRYSYNYCTLSYSMAFWGEEEWRNELDWLALNGVNVVLDATAQEEVWRRFLGKLGYSHEEAKDFIAGPAYYAWAYMANLSGFGGPVHDSWFEERTELARKNQQSMIALGMQPVLQGYSGMVPTDILNYATGEYKLSSDDVISQGEWCGFTRPYMLRTTNAAFDKYAALFYQCQKEVYGDVSNYYATDPFHEGGNTADMDPADISQKVLTAMLNADKDGIWIIQAWQGNPTTALLNGLDDVENGAQHALVLDLYAEKDPHHDEANSYVSGVYAYGDTKEFDDTPWVFCMLNNFGGRLGLHGHLDNLAEDIPAAMNNSQYIAGIGITPEASVNNPVLYDFLFETVWQDDVTKNLPEIDLSDWLDDYVTRRYGITSELSTISESINKAWKILKDTVYKSDLNMLGQGAPESVVNARPALDIATASSWGNAIISYDKVELEKAAKLLLEGYDVLKDSEGYMYDVANVLQQVLANSAQEYHKKMAAAYNSGNVEEFEKYAEDFMDIIDYMETVTGTTEYFLLGRWVEQAKVLAKNADDFTKELYELNAKALVTTWGSYNQTHGHQNLKDYSNRQWSGLIGDFYKERWKLWIEARTKQLKGENFTDIDDWFHWEWKWVRENTKYPTEATPADLKTLGLEIIEKYTSANPAADASRDAVITDVYAENYHPEPHASEGNPDYTIDGDPNTHWHTVFEDSARDTHYLIFTLDGVTTIDGMRFLQRSGSSNNGRITKFDLYVRETENDAWTLIVDDGSLDSAASWQMIDFNAVSAGQVKLQVVEALSDNTKKFATAAEIRFTTPKETGEEPTPVAITVATAPKTVYTEGETFDPTGLVLNLVYNDSNTEELAYSANAGITYDLTETLTVEDTNVVFTYKGLTISLEITVVEKVPELDADDESRDYPAEDMTLTGGTTLSTNLENLAQDGDANGPTWWQTDWNDNTSKDKLYFTIELDKETKIDALRYKPKFEGKDLYWGHQNGLISKYKVEVSADGTDGSWTTVAEGRWVEEGTDGDNTFALEEPVWWIAEFDKPVAAKYVRITGVETLSNGYAQTKEMSIGEIRVRRVVDKDELQEAITDAEQIKLDNYTTDSWTAFQNALTAARNVNADNAATIEEIDKALIDLRAAEAALKMVVYAEKDVFVKVDETVSILDTTGSYSENGLKDLDTQKATVNVTAKTVNDNKAHLFEQGSDWNLPAIIRYNENGGEIDLSECLYSFNMVGENVYEITGIATDYKTKKQTKVWLNTNESGNQEDSNQHGFPHTTTEEHMLVTKVMDNGTFKGFSFQDQDINKTNGKKYVLQFLNNWCVFNEVAPSNYPSDAPKTTAFQLYERVLDKNGQFKYEAVSEIQDGGMYLIGGLDVTAVVNNEQISAQFVVRPGTAREDKGLGRNDHIAKWVDGTIENGVNEVQITGVSSGDTSVIVGTTRYNIHVLNEKNITIKTGESVRIFDQSGMFRESGRDELDSTIAEANVEAKSITDSVAKLYQNNSYNGKAIGLSDCIYTFNRNADGTYNIAAVESTGETVYLNPFVENIQSKKGYPSRKDSERITIQKTDQGFALLEDTKKADVGIATQNYRLSFVNDWKIFNEDPVNDNGSPYTGNKTETFTLYQVKKNEDGYNYELVSSLSQIVDGGQYVIAANVNGTEYILRPSASTTNRNDHVAQRYSGETISVSGNEVQISGISVGDTSLTVGNTVYNIHVLQNEQYVKLPRKSSFAVTGTSVTLESGSEYVTLDKLAGNDQYQITAEKLGNATVIVDKEIYHITVVEEKVASGVGTSEGMEVKRLTMSANNTFDLCVINAAEGIQVTWSVIDKKTGKAAVWARVENGKVLATNESDSVEHNGYIVAELFDGTNKTTIQIELKLSPAPTGTNLRLYDIYIDDLHHTDVWYGWLYEFDNPDKTDTKNPILCDSTDLIKVVEGEVIYVSMGTAYDNAIDFFARPEEGYALTQMRATNTQGHYMRLEGATPEDTEFIKTPTVAGNGQYYEISKYATGKLVQAAMDIKCHGAQGFTKTNGAGDLSTILNYRSEKLPTLSKTVLGISSEADGSKFRFYNKENTQAKIGEYVFFKVDVTTYDCEDIITYTNVLLKEQLEDAEFVVKTDSGYEDLKGIEDTGKLPITDAINGNPSGGEVFEYYVRYKIKPEDVASVSHSVVNTVQLSYDYETTYSNGTFESLAVGKAEIKITDLPFKSLVVDYGLPVSHKFEKVEGIKYELESETTAYGAVTLEVTSEVDEETGVSKDWYVVTYTPTKMLKGPDGIGLKMTTADEEKINVIGVYPATTVYYEEGFANFTPVNNENDKETWKLDVNNKGNANQQAQYIESESVENSDYDENNAGEEDPFNYGYDAKYTNEDPGQSNGTEAESYTAGNTAEFTFTGTGLDIYANCQSEQNGEEKQLPTGTVTVLIRGEDDKIEKMLIVNTKVAGDEKGVTDAQNDIKNAYNMPIVSVNKLLQGEHNVKIIHTRTQEEIQKGTTYPIKLDGFKVYNTLSDHEVYEIHKEANPNYVEMRNVVLNAIDLKDILAESEFDEDGNPKVDENGKLNVDENGNLIFSEGTSIYAQAIAKKLTQVLDKTENGAAIILDKSVSSTDYKAENAQDLLDNGPKNELFLYKDQTLTFNLKAGLKNVQIGLKALNGPVKVEGTINKDISSSTDMFYVIGDIDADTAITITNTSSNILSVTDLKYFNATPDAQLFGEITEESLTSVLSAMGYPRKDETQEPAKTFQRIEGDDRYATAYAVAEELKEVLGVDKFDAVIVATGKNFADALSGSYLAYVKNAPILLTNDKRVDELTAYVKANLAEGGMVYILGGEKAVPKTVEAGLNGIDVKRLCGEDRYDTNIAVLKEAGAVGRELLIATGRGYADSLSASATGKPILLVKDEITEDHRAILRGFDGGKLYIIGGTDVVSEEIQTAIAGHGRIYRLAGDNRYGTSVKVAETFFPEAQTACFAYAKEFADGISGGPLAAALGAPMILTADGKTDDAAAYVQSKEIQNGIVFGGTARISDDSVNEIFGLTSDDARVVK